MPSPTIRKLLPCLREEGARVADYEVKNLKDGRTIALHRERSQRVRINRRATNEPSVVATEKTAAKEDKFRELTAYEPYPALRELLAIYLDETVQDPVESQGLWSLSAYPDTPDEPLFRLSVASTETIWGFDLDSEPADVRVLLLVSSLGGVAEKLTALRDPRVTHGSTDEYAVSRDHPVTRIECTGLDATFGLLDEHFLLDAAYELNLVLMQDGASLQKASHNSTFASAVIDAARGRSDQARSPRDAKPKLPIYDGEPVTTIDQLQGYLRWQPTLEAEEETNRLVGFMNGPAFLVISGDLQLWCSDRLSALGHLTKE